MFWFYVGPRKLEIKKTDLLVSDSLNVYPCQFQFSQDWNGLTKTAVFKAGTQAIEVLLDATNSCNIPWEVLLKHNLDLFVGCYGTMGEEIILNTTWTNVGKIYEGTKNKGVPGEDPTPDIYTQILSQIGSIEELSTENKDNLVSAINEVNQDLTDFKEQQAIDLSEKVDKTGGTVSGPILFTESVSPISLYVGEETPETPTEPSEPSGVLVSQYGFLKNSNGPLLINTSSEEVDFGNSTLLRGVQGNENISNSVPNMGQLKSSIPSKVSQLENDSDFATKQFVQDAIDNIDISGGGGTGGTSDHRELTNRNAPDQHPVYSISGLQDILNTIPKPMSAEQLREILSK